MIFNHGKVWVSFVMVAINVQWLQFVSYIGVEAFFIFVSRIFFTASVFFERWWSLCHIVIQCDVDDDKIHKWCCEKCQFLFLYFFLLDFLFCCPKLVVSWLLWYFLECWKMCRKILQLTCFYFTYFDTVILDI